MAGLSGVRNASDNRRSQATDRVTGLDSLFQSTNCPLNIVQESNVCGNVTFIKQDQQRGFDFTSRRQARVHA